MYQDRGENLKIKLKSVTKLKMYKTRQELTLRYTEQVLSEELRSVQIEIEILTQQLKDLRQEVSKMKYQIAMIGLCEVSEKSKIENHIANVVQHQDDFNNLFFKERKALEIHKMEIKKREEQEKELEQQKEKIMEEKNLLLQKEAKSIEDECETIEQECAVLMKRNKAIMLKLRRKLIESEETRRALTKGGESTKS